MKSSPIDGAAPEANNFSRAFIINCTWYANNSGRDSAHAASNLPTSAVFADMSNTNIFPKMIHCTLVRNENPNHQTGTAVHCGQLFAVENSILYDNRSPHQSLTDAPDLYCGTPSSPETFLADGFNYIQSHYGTPSIPSNLSTEDPLLEGLIDENGGKVPTILPQTYSPVVNHPSASTMAAPTDARGVIRNAPDLGAVELRTVIVNSNQDFYDGLATGNTSLRDALTDLVPAPGFTEADIAFDPAVFPFTGTIIALQSPLVASNANPLRIDAKTPGYIEDPIITLSAATPTRVLQVSAGTTLTLEGIRLQNGVSTTAGGGILNEGTLTLHDCVIEQNRTIEGTLGIDGGNPQIDAGNGGDSANGGGIYNSGTLTLFRTTVQSNQTGAGGKGGDIVFNQGKAGDGGNSGHGGGIANSGTLTLDESHILSNQTGHAGHGGDNSFDQFNEVLGGNAGDGGGICNLPGGELTIRDSVIRGNQTGNGGNGGNSNHIAGGSGRQAGWGGGIYHNGTSASINHSLVYQNTTGTGGEGGASVLIQGWGGDGGRGGGICGEGSSPTLVLENTTIHANQTGLGGSGSVNGTQGSGGGIFIDPGMSTLLIHITVTMNSSHDGGLSTVGVGPNTNLILFNSIVGENKALAGSVDQDTIGGFEYEGVNLIEVPGTGTSTGTGSRIAGPAYLAPLQDWGGKTLSRYPYPSSPAVDGALTGTFSPMDDQRGFPRLAPVIPTPDIGAVETRKGLLAEDLDNDNMNDFLEEFYGLDFTFDDSKEDKDMDGISNEDELKAFTNPCDPNSFLKITSFGPTTTPNQFQITWDSWPSIQYQIQSQSTLQGMNIPSSPLLARPGQTRSLETTDTFLISNPLEFIYILLP